MLIKDDDDPHSGRDKHEIRLSRRYFLKTVAIAAGAYLVSVRCNGYQSLRSPEAFFSQFADKTDRFSLALIADPQLAEASTHGLVKLTSQQKLTEIVYEINQMRPQPAFVVFDGDLVENVQPDMISNFVHRANRLHPPVILVHGNHDGRIPYTEFKQMQRDLNRTEMVQFSFDCGQWHFISFPCNIQETDSEARELLTWLAQDLAKHPNQPTMVFEHLHLMPQGLTQLEWYTYDRSLRMKILDLLATAGTVRYVICGHVHNGIQTSVKTAWSYRGINFITAPTCTAARNFGEEYPEFVAGMVNNFRQDAGGGYYLLIDINGDKAQVRARLVGVDEEYIYPDRFPEYQDQEPLWFQSVLDSPPNLELLNPSFEDGLAGWSLPYRYQSDRDPGFIAEAIPQPTRPNSNQAAFLFCREKGQAWAKDEMMELYQMVQIPPGASPTFGAYYFPEAGMKNGGGYLRLCVYHQKQLKALFLMDWGNGDKTKNFRMAQKSLYLATEEKVSAHALIHMGSQQKAFFWELPSTMGRWHQVQLNLQEIYDRALRLPGAFDRLAIDQLLVSIGVWVQEKPGSQAEAYFDDLSLTFDRNQIGLNIDQQSVPIDNRIFQTTFGKFYLNRKREDSSIN